jgi:hypothetical protein
MPYVTYFALTSPLVPFACWLLMNSASSMQSGSQSLPFNGMSMDRRNSSALPNWFIAESWTPMELSK